MFSIKYIKENAQPGSWRRGYDYHKKKQVIEAKLSRNVITGKVKGNFQDFYTTKLTIDKDFNIKAQCDCPLEEEWCKHAVSVGLYAIENKIFEEYYNKKTKTKSNSKSKSKQEEVLDGTADFKGNYTFILNHQRIQKFASVQIVDRSSGEVVSNLEALLTQAVELQKNNPDFLFTQEQKNEFLVMQELYKNAKFDKGSGYFDFPFNLLEKFLGFLSQVEEFIDFKTGERLIFDPNEWSLVLSVNVSVVGNVLLSLHWHRPEPEDIYPFEEVRYFSRNLSYYKYKNILFKADTPLSVVPHFLTKSTFTDIRDAEGGKFLYEELPKIRKNMKVEMSEILQKLTLERKPPKNVLILSLEKDSGMKAELEFEYDGIRVPYGRLAGKSPFVTVKKPEDGLIYWIKRNIKHETKAYEILINSKFSPMQTNNLYLDPDTAIDFYNFFIDKAGEDWIIEEKGDLSSLKVVKDGMQVCAKIDFDESVDSFQVEIYCICGKKKIDFEQVEKAMFQGIKYFEFEGVGFIEVPHAKLMILSKMLNSYDAQKLEEYQFSVKTFRAGLIAELKELGIVLKMSKKFEHFWTQISTFNIAESVEFPAKVKAVLREYQERGLSWLWFLYQYGLNGILADDMGLGKTLQMLCLIQKAKDKEGAKPTLVIAPTSVVFNWENEIAKFTPDLSVLTLTGVDRHDYFKKITGYDIILTSYALVRRDIELYKKFDFRLIVLDESQNIKNHEAITAQAVKRISSDHRFAMSGTPIENKLSELWSVFDFLMPDFLYDLSEFKYRFITPISEKGDKTVENRLKKQVYPFILRRMKRDVAKDLPEKIENIAYCEMTPEQEDLYQQVLEDTRATLLREIQEKGFKNSKMSIFTALTRLRQICCHPKLVKQESIGSGKFELLMDMIEEITSEGHRILLFSQFVQMLDVIKDKFERTGIKYEYLTGETKDRKTVVDNFNNNEEIKVFLLSLKAGGTGLNLTGADYVIHYDPWWNPAVEDQATDRAYRIGQTKNVMVYRLITKNSVEEKIQQLKGKKRDLVDAIISVDRDINKTISYDDIKDILSV
ncbi:MAG: SNF2-related protein [Candidatus Gastranaerophilales bacterium]|nr:SNF2-related protein [Candidatus Gastranaerophilales bacterium]